MNGPTIVPLRVSTASTAIGRLWLRFITLTSVPTISLAHLFQPLVVDEERGLPRVAVCGLDHQTNSEVCPTVITTEAELKRVCDRLDSDAALAPAAPRRPGWTACDSA